MTAGQLALGLEAGLCDYGLPKFGDARVCERPATHAAVCHQQAYSCGAGACRHLIGQRLDAPEHVARIECCRDHADYYATAWAWGHVRQYPDACRSRHQATWIEALGVAA